MFLRTLIVISSLYSTIAYTESPSRTDRKEEINRSLNLIGASFGPAKFLKNGKEIGYHIQTRSDFDIIDQGSALIALNGFFDENKNLLLDFSIGARYFFLSNNLSPFVGGDLGLGLIFKEDFDPKFGFTLGAQTGIQFFRNSDVHIEIALNYKGHTKYNPNLISLTVGISSSSINIF
jgi:hypothetical protein